MKRILLPCLLLLGLLRLGAAEAPGMKAPDSYRLMNRDQISISVYDEPELGAVASIDASGQVRIPLLDDVPLVGLTVREAEKKLEQLYIEREFLKKPMVTIRIAGYAQREVTVFGAVRTPGILPFQPEVASMTIVEVVSKLGGFTGIARSDRVRVTRHTPEGDKTLIVNVKVMIEGGGRGTIEPFLVYPGDQIYVDDRLL